MKIFARRLTSLSCIAFLSAACQGSDSSAPKDDSIAQQDAALALENIQFQNNSRDLLDPDSLAPEMVRGYAPEVLRGSVPDFIRGKRSAQAETMNPFTGVDCVSYVEDTSDPNWIVHHFDFEEGCVVDGVTQAGGFDLLESNPPSDGGFAIKYRGYQVGGELWDGRVGVDSTGQGAGYFFDVVFGSFLSPKKGLIDGTCQVASERGYYYGYNWAFQGFTWGRGCGTATTTTRRGTVARRISSCG